MNPPKKKPSWFNEKYEKWVTILDHIDTFENIEHTPSKNSNAIEFTLQNIPQLSEHFVYFNDDVFVNQPLPYTHFFTRAGAPILASKVRKTAPTASSKLPFTVPRLAKGFYVHAPIPLLRSELKNFEKKYPDYVNWVRSHKRRATIGCTPCTKAGLPCPCQQIQMSVGPYMYDKGVAILRNMKEAKHCTSAYITSDCPGVLDQWKVGKVLEHMQQKTPKTFVIQDVSADSEKHNEARKKMLTFFNKKFPEKAPFEK